MCNFYTDAPDPFPHTTLVDNMDFSDEGDSYGCRLRGYVIAFEDGAKGSGVSFRSSLIFGEPGPVFATTPAGPVARNGSPCSHARGWPPDGLHGRERDRRLPRIQRVLCGPWLGSASARRPPPSKQGILDSKADPGLTGLTLRPRSAFSRARQRNGVAPPAPVPKALR